MDPHAIIVGAGHNALVAANVLADAGWSVDVVETNDTVGGAVRSAELLPGFECDLFSAFHPLGYVSPVLRSLRLHEYGLAWSRAPAALGHCFPDGRTAVIEADPEATAAGLEQWAAGDGDRWLAVLAGWRQVRDPLVRALLAPLPAAGPVARLARTVPAGDLMRLTRLAVSSARTYAQETWKGEGARTLLTGNALHADISPESAGSALFGWLLSMLAQDVGFPVPRGGSGRLTAALADRFQERGGRIRTGVAVRRVVVEGGRATGVILGDGSVLRAQRAVLAGVSAPALYGSMLNPGDLPVGFLDDLGRFQWDNPTVKINWMRSEPVPWRDPAAARCGTLHLGVDRNDLSQGMTDLSLGRMPERPFVLAGQMTLADPTRSAPGTETLWAYTHLAHSDDAGELVEHADSAVARVESMVNGLAPGFEDGVVKRVVQHPRELAASDANLYQGAVNGGTGQLSQQLLWRPTPGLGGARTPVRGLYLASAAAHPGGGVHGACGNNAAVAALHDAAPVRGPVLRAATAAMWRSLYPAR